MRVFKRLNYYYDRIEYIEVIEVTEENKQKIKGTFNIIFCSSDFKSVGFLYLQENGLKKSSLTKIDAEEYKKFLAQYGNTIITKLTSLMNINQ